MLCIDPSFACIRIINTRFVDTKCKNILILLSGGNIHLINTNIFWKIANKKPSHVADAGVWWVVLAELTAALLPIVLVGWFIYPPPFTSYQLCQNTMFLLLLLFLTQNKYTIVSNLSLTHFKVLPHFCVEVRLTFVECMSRRWGGILY